MKYRYSEVVDVQASKTGIDLLVKKRNKAAAALQNLDSQQVARMKTTLQLPSEERQIDDIGALIQIVSNLKFFRKQSYKDQKLICFNLRPLELLPRDVLFEQGELASGFFIVVRGEAEIIMDGQKIGTLIEGDSFGEIALHSEEGVRTATVQCTESCFLGVLRKEDYERILKSSKRTVELLERHKEADAARAQGAQNEPDEKNCVLHVRGIKDTNEGTLMTLFSQYGTCLAATIRIKLDLSNADPEMRDRSWALVTMMDSTGFERALEETTAFNDLLFSVAPHSNKKSAASTGMMSVTSNVRKQTVGKLDKMSLITKDSVSILLALKKMTSAIALRTAIAKSKDPADNSLGTALGCLSVLASRRTDKQLR